MEIGCYTRRPMQVLPGQGQATVLGHGGNAGLICVACRSFSLLTSTICLFNPHYPHYPGDVESMSG